MAALTWLIPDAYLATPADDDPINKHQAAGTICVLNTTVDDANLIFDFYFEDRAAVEGIKVTVPAKRCPHIRLDKPEQIAELTYQIPFDVPYGVRIRSDDANHHRAVFAHVCQRRQNRESDHDHCLPGGAAARLTVPAFKRCAR